LVNILKGKNQGGNYQLIMKSNTSQTPWLLQRNQLSLLATILPPIAFVIVRLNKHKLSEKTVDGVQFFASLMTCLWLIKLLPHHWITLTLLILMSALSVFMLVVKLLK